ncbi:MAG: N-acetylmuramoyl-L-alanine amidase, partial [bacterium]|nr:N-acetylmuramoyl-L-alanine amidase [bacterium]
TYSSLKDLEVISLSFDDSTAFNVFEENSNLYLDINNLNVYQDGILDPVKRAIPDLQTTRLALDKLRITIPGVSSKNISVKTDSDNKEIRIYSKAAAIVQKPKKNPTSSYTPIVSVKKKQPEISNLFSVVIDAGHGGNDVGATRNNIYEKDITLKISKMVEKNLNKKNVKTYMVRDKDKTVSLAERCEFSNEKKPNLFVSIHVNSSTNDTSYGVETHWYKEDSKQYAEYVHREMQKKIKSWKTIDRGLFKSQFYVINHTEAPAILCEIGFISNKNEREEIIKTKRQEEIAEAIADGIYNYLKAKK